MATPLKRKHEDDNGSAVQEGKPNPAERASSRRVDVGLCGLALRLVRTAVSIREYSTVKKGGTETGAPAYEAIKAELELSRGARRICQGHRDQ
jgi:hypothetical protein